MPRHRLITLVAALSLAACGDPAARVSTAPASAPALTIAQGPTCTRGAFDALSAQIDLLYATSVRTEARQLLGRVRTRCPGKDAVLNLVQQTLAWRSADATLVSTDDTALWAFFTSLFDVIGFGLDNGALALATEGFIGVCTAGQECKLVANAQTSGVLIYPGALGAATERFLVTGAPIPCRGTTAAPGVDEFTDLQLFGQCIQISVDPKAGDSFRLNPAPGYPAPAIVQTCLSDQALALAKYLTAETVNLGDAPTTRPRLAQRSGQQTNVKLTRRPASTFFTPDCHKAVTFAEALDRAPSALDRLLEVPTVLAVGRAAEWLLLPRTANAGHGGLGSIGGFVEEEFSKFGPADPFVFQGSFDNPYPSATVPNVVRTADVPGQQPVDDDLGRATWAIGFQLPGYVRVQAAPFGGFLASDKNVVQINQGGGASSSKQGLEMLANLAFFEAGNEQDGSRANAGKYRIRWTSSIASPRAGGSGAPFVALGQANNTVSELVRFAYVNGPNAQSGSVHLNGVPVTGASWQQNQPQRFEIIVDLSAGKSYLRKVALDSDVTSGILATSTFTPGPVLTQVGWRLGRQDNQVIAMDRFEIVRLPDAYVIQ